MPPESPIQIKICGLTDVDQAVACAELGAHAIGLIFYPKSPRHLELNQARQIARHLPPNVPAVGVFVNESFEDIMRTVAFCGLGAVQLHGQEAPELVRRLRAENRHVIKALFSGRAPALNAAPDYHASAFLVECGKGELPGGNALTWNWEEALTVDRTQPLILAGGLDPANIAQAIQKAQPDAVDVSSGVEAKPGRKDLKQVARLIDAVRATTPPHQNIRDAFHRA